jgi:uncharacterized protein (DUF433 family)
MDTTPVNHIEIMNGSAVIRGRNLKAKLVASMHVKGGASIEEVMEHYSLSHAEVHSALAYYYDNQGAIEQSFDEAAAYAREVGISSEDLKAKMRARQRGQE